MMGYGHGFGWMWLIMLIGIAIVVVLVVLLVRAFAAPSQPLVQAPPPMPGVAPAAGADALRILDERLARGEIDPADYEERRNLLMQNRSG